MAIPVILRGDTASKISIVIEGELDSANDKIILALDEIRREIARPQSGEKIDIMLSAIETTGLSLGTHKIYVFVQNASGKIRSLPWVKVKVTDSPSEVYDVLVRINAATLDVENATAEDTLGGVKEKMNKILSFLRGTACVAFSLLFLCGAKVEDKVLNDIPGTDKVVTNVDLTGLATSESLNTVGNTAFNALSSASFARDTANTAIGRASTAINLVTTATNLATSANNNAKDAKGTAELARTLAVQAQMTAGDAQTTAAGAQAAANAAAEQSSSALSATGEIQRRIDVEVNPAINSNAEKINTVSQILEGKNFRIMVSNITERLALATFEVNSTNGWQKIWNETNAIEEAKIEIKNNIASNHYTKAQSDNITKETRKWSSFDSTTGEAAPDGFTQISSKNGIILGADLGYLNVQGSDYWVLSGNGNINVSTNGMISICDSSGKAVFRSVKGDAQLKGAIPGAFSVQKNVNGKDIITIGYLFNESVKPPRMEFSNSLDPGEVNWIKDTDEGAPFTAVWDGATCTVTVDADSKGFFRAFYWQGGESYVEATQTMNLQNLRIGGKNVGTATINGLTVLVLEDQ